MKTKVPNIQFFSSATLIVVGLLISFLSKAQTYTTIANGAWNSAATWQGGLIPNANSIPLTAVINIKHRITYAGADINNNGTIHITNNTGLTPRLSVADGVKFNNNLTGKFYLTNGEYRQYRFTSGTESGIAQSGEFKNSSGYVSIKNSFVEIAQDFSNLGSGLVSIWNSSLALGRNYDNSNSSIDSIQYSSISIGMQGYGNYIADGLSSYFYMARFQVASTGGKFNLKSGIFSGTIDYITMKNHVTGTYSSDDLVANSGIITTGITLNAYCINDITKYKPNGKFTGPCIKDCTSNYFPAKLFVSTAPGALDFSTSPVLTAGVRSKSGGYL